MQAIVGHIRLFPLLFILAIVPTALWPLFAVPPVYNTTEPSILMLPAVALGGLFLLWMLPRPSTVLFASLLLAGVTANIFHAALAPVPDYIPVPFSDDHFFNAADVAILAALATTPFLLRDIWRRYWV
jgi:hypothetical protein